MLLAALYATFAAAVSYLLGALPGMPWIAPMRLALDHVNYGLLGLVYNINQKTLSLEAYDSASAFVPIPTLPALAFDDMMPVTTAATYLFATPKSTLVAEPKALPTIVTAPACTGPSLLATPGRVCTPISNDARTSTYSFAYNGPGFNISAHGSGLRCDVRLDIDDGRCGPLDILLAVFIVFLWSRWPGSALFKALKQNNGDHAEEEESSTTAAAEQDTRLPLELGFFDAQYVDPTQWSFYDPLLPYPAVVPGSHGEAAAAIARFSYDPIFDFVSPIRAQEPEPRFIDVWNVWDVVSTFLTTRLRTAVPAPAEVVEVVVAKEEDAVYTPGDVKVEPLFSDEQVNLGADHEEPVGSVPLTSTCCSPPEDFPKPDHKSPALQPCNDVHDWPLEAREPFQELIESEPVVHQHLLEEPSYEDGSAADLELVASSALAHEDETTRLDELVQPNEHDVVASLATVTEDPSIVNEYNPTGCGPALPLQPLVAQDAIGFEDCEDHNEDEDSENDDDMELVATIYEHAPSPLLQESVTPSTLSSVMPAPDPTRTEFDTDKDPTELTTKIPDTLLKTPRPISRKASLPALYSSPSVVMNDLPPESPLSRPQSAPLPGSEVENPVEFKPFLPFDLVAPPSPQQQPTELVPEPADAAASRVSEPAGPQPIPTFFSHDSKLIHASLRKKYGTGPSLDAHTLFYAQQPSRGRGRGRADAVSIISGGAPLGVPGSPGGSTAQNGHNPAQHSARGYGSTHYNRGRGYGGPGSTPHHGERGSTWYPRGRGWNRGNSNHSANFAPTHYHRGRGGSNRGYPNHSTHFVPATQPNPS